LVLARGVDRPRIPRTSSKHTCTTLHQLTLPPHRTRSYTSLHSCILRDTVSCRLCKQNAFTLSITYPIDKLNKPIHKALSIRIITGIWYCGHSEHDAHNYQEEHTNPSSRTCEKFIPGAGPAVMSSAKTYGADSSRCTTCTLWTRACVCQLTGNGMHELTACSNKIP